jgi:hypothetical protein
MKDNDFHRTRTSVTANISIVKVDVTLERPHSR